MAMDKKNSQLLFYVNGEKIVEEHADPSASLLSYLREKLLLTGCKPGCGSGSCGACTVMISFLDDSNQTIRHEAITSCITPLCSIHGKAVTTVEGFGSTRTQPHPIQESLVEHHGIQCGYCTPGIVMSMAALLRNQPQPPIVDIEDAISGNLCRCTGYRSIMAGLGVFSKESAGEENDSASQEIFGTKGLPNGLEGDVAKERLTFTGVQKVWIRPTDLQDLLKAKEQYPQASLVAGNSSLENQLRRNGYRCVWPALGKVTKPTAVQGSKPVLITVSDIPELQIITVTDEGLTVGSAVTVTLLLQTLEKEIKESKKRGCKPFNYEALHQLAKGMGGRQARNVATIGGALACQSYAFPFTPAKTDLFTGLFGIQSRVTFIATDGSNRTITLGPEAIDDIGQLKMASNEIIYSTHIPCSKPNEYCYSFNPSSAMTSMMRVELDPTSSTMNDICLVFTTLSKPPTLAQTTADQLKGRPWKREILEVAHKHLSEDIAIPDDAPGGKSHFRRTLIHGLFFKFYLKVFQDFQQGKGIEEAERSAIESQPSLPVKGIHDCEDMTIGKSDLVTVGKSVPHVTSLQAATGEVKFARDLPTVKGELHMALVMSTEAHASIVSIDISAALAIKGVVAFISYDDIPAAKTFGLLNEEPVFAKDMVYFKGQAIGAVVADCHQMAQIAARKVKVTYQPLDPALITIEDAVAAGSFHDMDHDYEFGSVSEGFAESSHILEGELCVGGQEHIYMETMGAIAVPKESQEMDLIVTSQCTNMVEENVSNVIGVPRHKVSVRSRIVGGGFGGKYSRPMLCAIPAAVAAMKLNRPVRCFFDRSEDMVMGGYRQPYKAKYKVGFTDEGRLLALDLKVDFNVGYFKDFAIFVMVYAMLRIEVAYKIPNVKTLARLCRTNLAASTAFRLFGTDSGIITENIIKCIAHQLNLNSVQVREINIMNLVDKTYFGQDIVACTARDCFVDCLQKSSYKQRKAEIADFNRRNRWNKRGIEINIIQHTTGFPYNYYFQGGALVNIYADGSVLVHHGGVELGQGLNTKIVQIASTVLEVPLSYIHIGESNTATVPNCTGTSASTGSDIFGLAVKNACEKLLQRLKVYKEKAPDGSWNDWVKAAYLDCTSLSATGFFRGPKIREFNPKSKDWEVGLYPVYGSGCTEVELDVLTGECKVLKTTLVVDVGRSLNPAIDIGQVEGAFIQAQGLYTTEERLFTSDGSFLNAGVGLYQAPYVGDVAREFQVYSLKGGAPHPNAQLFQSKAIGEAAVLGGVSVYLAIREAVAAARVDSGLTGPFQLDVPATPERVRLACKDHITDLTATKDTDQLSGRKPWAVSI